MSATFDSLRHFGRLRLAGHSANVYLRTGLHHAARNARASGWAWCDIADAAMMDQATARRMAKGVNP